MNYLDLFFGIVLLAGAVWGFQKGFIKAILGFLGIGLAIWGGIKFSGFAQKVLSDLELIPEKFIHIVSFLITILLIYLAIRVVAKIIHSVAHTVGLGIFNRLGGALFGVLLNILMLSALIFYVLPFVSGLEFSETIKQSRILPYLNQIIELFKSNFYLISHFK
jgi:membrane protein required for colicin V production